MTDDQVLVRLNRIDKTLDAYANTFSEQGEALGEILKQLHTLHEDVSALKTDVHTIRTLLGIADLDPAQVRAAVLAGTPAHTGH